MKTISEQSITTFQRKILRFYSLHGRTLPFRNTRDPYKITVAEIMLQQTQVERVVPKYRSWIGRWPSWSALSRASTRQVLAAWSGLGYNRRALHIRTLAREVTTRHKGRLPTDVETLITLPGIGPYTARAILIFAFNAPLITIDTNIRKVLLHEFDLPPSTSVPSIEKLAYRCLPRGKSRDWHNALMDYSRLVLPNRIPSIPALGHQSRFKGSLRQIRGEIVRRLISSASVRLSDVAKDMKRDLSDVRQAAEALSRDGLVIIAGSRVRLR